MVYIVSNENRAGGNDRALERRVEGLARAIAEIINTGQVEERQGLRDLAVSLLRDEVQVIEPPSQAEPLSAGSFNPFGIGIPFVLMGAVLVFLFPLVGLLMFAAAAVMIAWGVGTTVLARH